MRRASTGDLVSQYDGEARRGFVLGLQTASGVTTCQSNHRTLHFGIDSGTEPRWTDRDRPGNAVYVMALAVSNGWLYAGTCEPGAGEAGRVHRLEQDRDDASVTRWAGTGPLDGPNAVSALAEHEGAVFAGTAKYRLGGNDYLWMAPPPAATIRAEKER